MRPPPPAPASAHAPPPSCTQTGAENAGTGPPPPPGSTAPGEGASAGLGLPARPAPAAAHTCRCSPPCPGPAGPQTRTLAAAGPHRNALEDAPGRGCPDVFGVAVADNGGLLAAAIAHQVIHVALPTGHLRALRTAAGTARSSRRSGGGGSGRRRRGRRGGGGEEAALRRHRPPPSPRSCGGRMRGPRRGTSCAVRPARPLARLPAAAGLADARRETAERLCPQRRLLTAAPSVLRGHGGTCAHACVRACACEPSAAPRSGGPGNGVGG